MDSVEESSLVKIDILAQGGLAVMRDVKEMLRHPKLVTDRCIALPLNFGPPDLDALQPWTDAQVWEMLAGGGDRTEHHIESPAMISVCKMWNVLDIDTLIAIVSVIRAEAANESKKMEFPQSDQRLSPTYYPHPSLEPCLRSTNGLVAC